MTSCGYDVAETFNSAQTDTCMMVSSPQCVPYQTSIASLQALSHAQHLASLCMLHSSINTPGLHIPICIKRDGGRISQECQHEAMYSEPEQHCGWQQPYRHLLARLRYCTIRSLLNAGWHAMSRKLCVTFPDRGG